MKVLHIIVTLSIASNLSLHSMNIVPRKITHSPLTGTTKRHLNINKEKIKQFFDMNNINNLVNLSSIIAASTTANPLYLLPIIPQILHRTSTYLHKQKELPTQHEQEFRKDLDFFSYDIAYRLETIDKINSEIKCITEKQDTAQLKRLGVLTEHENKINELETKKITEELKLLEKTASLFKIYGINASKHISEYVYEINASKPIHILVQEYESKLNQQKPIKAFDYSCLAVNGINLFPMLALSAFATFECGTEVTIIGSLAIILNTGVMGKNMFSLIDKNDEANKESANLKHAIELLKIYQKHAKTQDTQTSQTNE